MADLDGHTFQRVEKKYLLTAEEYERLYARLSPYIQMDQYGLHTICNIYYDTDQFELVRHSIEKPPYKEKLRLRSYGIPQMDGEVFLEIKKKWEGIVYKRRISMNLEEAKAYLEEGRPLGQSGQIEREIDYFIQFYQPKPKLYIAYDREAYFAGEDETLRITFDRNIRSREEDLQLELGDAGKLLLDRGCRLMEIKVSAAYPMWLVNILSELKIYPISFSKYGDIYKSNCMKFTESYIEIPDGESRKGYSPGRGYAAAAV